MKILLIPSWYPYKNNPIWGNYFIKQGEELAKYADVSMLNINRVGIKDIFRLKKEKELDGFSNTKYIFKFFQKSILNSKSINVAISYIGYRLSGYKAYKEFKKIIGKPDIIIAQSILPAGILAKKISKKEKIPFVVHAHAVNILDNEKYFKYRNIVLKKANGYFAVSNNVKKKLSSLGRKDVKIVPNFIDTKKFKIIKKQNEVFNLINISNFFEAKAIDVLLKAINILVYKKNFKNIKLFLLGTGDFEKYYKKTAADLRLDNYVKFTGYVPNNKISTYLDKAHVLCVSSTRETFSIPLIEAMSCGIPGISTKCGGPEEIINKDNGLLVPIGDANAYADAIIYMYNNYNRYDPVKIKNYVYKKYDKDVVCKDFIKKLEDVIKIYNKNLR